MVAINNRRPTLMTLPKILDAYIGHQKEVITRRSQYELRKSRKSSTYCRRFKESIIDF